MTKENIIMLFRQINFYFPNRISGTKEQINEMAEAWSYMLQGEDVNKLLTNLKYHVRESTHPPTIADLVKEREIKSNTPGALETRLMIEQTEKETTPEIKADPEHIKKQIEFAREKIREVKLNELDRKFNRTS